MSIVNAAGTILTKAALEALTTAVVVPDARKLTAPVYETYTYPGAKQHEGGKRLLFRTGQIVSQKLIDDMYTASAAAFTSISPATGPAAGGTNVTITGTGFSGTTGVTVGGAAATNVSVVSNTKITCTTPAGTAGARDVVIQDASGNVTATGAYTYT